MKPTSKLTKKSIEGVITEIICVRVDSCSYLFEVIGESVGLKADKSLAETHTLAAPAVQVIWLDCSVLSSRISLMYAYLARCHC
jgi:hypothetical protein